MAADEAGLWTLQTSIFPENRAGIALHQSAGFRTLGVRERIGRHHGVWRDVVFLERRRTDDLPHSNAPIGPSAASQDAPHLRRRTPSRLARPIDGERPQGRGA
jgi:hypothetical protein